MTPAATRTAPAARAALGAALALAAGALQLAAAADPPGSTATMDLDALWTYSDPAASERRFRDAVTAAGPDLALEARTQLARALGLQRRFAEAHAELDAVQRELPPGPGRARVRYLLERGRVLNSSGSAAAARPLFVEAYEQARALSLDALAVDAAHMVAVVEQPEGALEWNRRAMALAASSTDPKARRWSASLHNNLGWAHHDRGDYAKALEHFEAALAERRAGGDPEQTRVAQWMVARALRSLGRHEEALAMQRALAAEHDALGTTDAFVDEEIGENLLALGRGTEARPHFARAWAALRDDPWLAEKEPARIARLGRLAEGRADVPGRGETAQGRQP